MRITAAVLCVLLFGNFSLAEDDAQSLVEKAVARHGAITSGRITYLRELPPELREMKQKEINRVRREAIEAERRYVERRNAERTNGTPVSLPPDEPEIKFKERPQEFVLSGDDWLLRSPGELASSVQGSVKGTFFRHVDFRPLSVARSRRLELFDDASDADLMTGSPITRPVCAGTFWMDEQAAFAKEHSKEFQLNGARTIDGVETRVCEYKMPIEVRRLVDKRFEYATEALLRRVATLRLFIAPQLGHLLPMIEYLDENGDVKVRFTASNFSEVSPGLWVPALIQKYDRDAKGELQSSGTTSITYEMMNQRIPEEDFVVELWGGTLVFDRRSGRDLHHYNLTTARNLSDMLSVEKKQ